MKSIICVETNETYPSIREAAKANDCCETSIYLALSQNRPTKGKHFKYTESETTSDEKEITVSKPSFVKGKGKRTNGNTNAVLCITDGSIYTSCTDAAEQNNINKSNMSHVCRGKGRSVKGKQYCYIKDINQHLDEISDAISKKNLYLNLLEKETKRNNLKSKIADCESLIQSLEDQLVKANDDLNNAKQELFNM